MTTITNTQNLRQYKSRLYILVEQTEFRLKNLLSQESEKYTPNFKQIP